MRLRAIETVGFKSFADKIELNFVDGITAIVGPNGSGKSNVSDAIRWVLGEQSMKNLRGGSMEDVIFSGSKKRKALNIAEVTLYFSNTEGILPVDFKEVSVTRRLFRSGDSSYYINKSLCRLKDIHELFSDTGLGKGSMSIIGQNKVDEILNNRPEERRVIFEEAAGISRYKIRKRDALKRLEETDSNLLRLNDIKSEIVDRLDPMKKSAEKTAKYNELNQQLRSCKITLAVQKTDKANQVLQKAKKQIELLKEEETDFITKLNINENKSFMITEKLESVASVISDLQKQILNIETTTEKLTGQKAVLEERIVQNKDRINSIENDFKRFDLESMTLSSKIKESEERLKEHNEVEKQARDDKEKEEKELLKIEESILDIERKQEIEHVEILDRKRNILQISNDIKNIESSIFLNEKKVEKLNKEKIDLNLRLEELKALITNTKEDLNKTLKEKTLLLEEKDFLVRENLLLASSIQDNGIKEKSLESNIFSLNERISILQKLQHDYDGFSYGVKKVMSKRSFWGNKIKGTVGDLIDVPIDYVRAIETALGSSIQNIITEDDIAAKSAIEYLKKEKAGRATFLPLKNLYSSKLYLKDEEKILSSNGILGFANKLISYESSLSPAIDFLLGRTLIAKDITSALSALKNRTLRIRIVTLDGDVINAGGSMSGGSKTNKETGFLSRTKEIKESEKKLIKLKKEKDVIIEEKKRLVSKFSKQEEKVIEYTKSITELDVILARMTVILDENEKQLKQLSLGYKTLVFEENDILNDNESMKKEVEIKISSKKIAEDDDIYKINISGEMEGNLQHLKKEKDQVSIRFNNAKSKYEMAAHSAQFIKEQFLELETEQNKLLSSKERIEKEKESFQLSIDKAKEEQKGIENNIVIYKEKLIQVKLEQDKNVAERLELLPEQKNIEKQIKDIKSSLNGIQNRLRNTENIFIRYETELNIAIEQLHDNYNLTLEEAKKEMIDIADNELETSITRLENEINDLGPINPSAIEEYQEIKNRYDFMVAQYDDLMIAKNDLNALISDIDKTMIKRFREAFNAINEHFKECFIKLFGGGTASLKLLNPNDILSTGIDMEVQPPGKKLQILSLLSGGERSLTVIALLFAMLSYRPAPFCVLDEVDAALDEVNVDRFNTFVEDYAKKTQFIIITHRKATMHAADLLHGITMEESGVSKLISIKMLEGKGELQ